MRPLLAVLCLLMAYLAHTGAGHECGNITPQRVGYTAMASSRTKRQTTERQPIRIVPWYYEEDFNQLSPELREKYKSVVVQSIDYLSSFLSVDRLSQNITLQRFCNTEIQLGSLNPFDHCTLIEPCQDTFCALPEFQIPEEHLRACKTCDPAGSTNCSTEGQDGPGVPDADIVIYVGARDVQCGTTRLAYAAHCFQDRSTDRPIAGVVNLCPLLANQADIDTVVLTVVHELTHALVFHPWLMPFYRDDNGNPRTPRDELYGLPIVLGFDPTFLFQPSADTILQETVQREAFNGVYDIDTVKVVTPAVVREARRHFDCPTLNGMELENAGGPGTQFFHWKKRLVENEGMTGVISTNGVFSRLTFALYEDSGWYDVDYSVASPLKFGQCLGCDFAEKSCFSYGLDTEPFCNEQELTSVVQFGSRERGANTSCTYDRSAIAFCNLIDVTTFSLSIPIQYQYFLDPNLGGVEQTIDYCPVRSGASGAHCQRQRDLGDNVFLESVGPISKCVDFKISTDWEYNNAAVPPIHGGACYEVSCSSEGNVAITVGQSKVLCQSAGQEVTVPAGGFDMVIICPAFEDICWESSSLCPSTTTPPPSANPTTSSPRPSASPPTSSPPPSGPATTSPPPSGSPTTSTLSGLSIGGTIAVGVILGLLGLVAVAFAVVFAVVVAVMYKHRDRSSSGNKRHPTNQLEEKA